LFRITFSNNTPQITTSRSATTASRGSGSFRLGVDTGAGRGSDTSTGRAGSQKTDTVAPAAKNSSGVSHAVETTTPGHAGLQKLLETLSALGMSTSGLNISYSEEAVGYPGGSYLNKQISVTSGGKTEQFSADLTEKNPLVTAYEMQRYFGVVPNAAAANGTVRHG